MSKITLFFCILAVLSIFATLIAAAASRNEKISRRRQLALRKDQEQRGKVRGGTPTGHLTLLTDGGEWYENLWFDGNGGLWVTDDLAGKIYKLTRPSWNGPVTKTLWISGFKSALGMSNVVGQANRMYAVVRLPDTCVSNDGKSSNDHGAAVISFDTITPNSYIVALCTPVLGNGFAVNTGSALNGIIYTANEGDFWPGKGVVIQADPTTEASITFDQDLDAADGVFLDQQTQLLYVSEVLKGEIRIYSTLSRTLTKKYSAPNTKMVDDFCIAYVNWAGNASSTPFMFAAGFWNDDVVAFPADGNGPGRILASGFYSPTSVRQGRGTGWDNPNSMYITEGGISFGALNRRVWELHLN